MNRKHLIALALVLAGPAAFAQSSEIDLQHFGATQPATTTRTAVRAEVIKARSEGALDRTGEVDASATPALSTRSRGEVRKEAAAATTRDSQVPHGVQVGH